MVWGDYLSFEYGKPVKSIVNNKTIDKLTSGNIVADMIRDKANKKDKE